jgi:hypothetical protein
MITEANVCHLREEGAQILKGLPPPLVPKIVSLLRNLRDQAARIQAEPQQGRDEDPLEPKEDRVDDRLEHEAMAAESFHLP